MQATSKTWGTTSAEFYAELQNKSVQIVTMDGKIYKGLLVGVDQYDLILKLKNGMLILMPKHAIRLVSLNGKISLLDI